MRGRERLRVAPRRYAESVRGARAGYRLEMSGKADAARGVPALVGRSSPSAWRGVRIPAALTPASSVLVAERQRLLDVMPGDAERLADARRQQHARLPEALDLVHAYGRSPTPARPRRPRPRPRATRLAGSRRGSRARACGRVALRLVAHAETRAPFHASPREKYGISPG